MRNTRSQNKLIITIAIYLLSFVVGAFAQTSGPGPLDFLGSKDPSFALFVNTSNVLETSPGNRINYPNELVLLTGIPFNPAISARIDLLGPVKLCFLCGGLRSVVISPDGDTALVSSEPSGLQPPTPRVASRLFLLRNLRTFANSKNRDDLRIREFSAADFPQLDNVSGLTFGPDGTWAVVNTAAPGYSFGDHDKIGGSVVVITGLPDNPVFSAPFPVPMHSLGNIDLSMDGQTLLLSDNSDTSGGGTIKSNVIVVHGIRPGDEPWVAAMTTFATPPGFVTNAPPPVRDAKLTLDGRFILAPIPLIRALDAQGKPLPVNQIAVLGPVHDGRLDTARILTEADGVTGGPYQAGISPDADSALVGGALDSGSASLVTGLSGGISHPRIMPLPPSLFGGSSINPKPHAQVVFTPDGNSALVINPITPPLAFSGLSPSLSVLTGFSPFFGKNIRLAATLSDLTLNPFDNRQQVATVPSGLMDYVNLYLGPEGDEYRSLLNDAMAEAGRGNRNAAVEKLAGFIRKTGFDAQLAVLTPEQSGVLLTLASAGIEALIGHSKSVAGGHNPGPVAPNSIAILKGGNLGPTQAASSSGTLPTALAGISVRIVGPGGDGFAPLYRAESGQITYVAPANTFPGKAVALVSNGDRTVAAVTLSVDPVAPQLFTLNGSRTAAGLLQRVKADGTQTTETLTEAAIDLGPDGDRVYLVLAGTGIRGRSRLESVTARIASQDSTVLFAGPQPSYDGLDQVNLLLPRTLIGSGVIDITLSVDGWVSNGVQIEIR